MTRLMVEMESSRGSWATSEDVRRRMQSNRGADTKPELALRRALHGLGLRYRKHHRIEVGGVRVRPDIVFTRAQVAVFLDGCFWHRCPIHATYPQANADYWASKLGRNVERDCRVDMALEGAGWCVVRVWEHEPADSAAVRVASSVLETLA